MAKSPKDLQNELVNNGFLDKLGNSSTDYAGINELPSTKQIIILSSVSFIQKVKEELQRLGKVSSGNLEDGITSGDLIQDRDGYEIDLGYKNDDPASKYFDFVNKGVRGVESGRPNSPYGFKNLKVSLQMQKSIMLWMRKRGNAARREDQTKNLSANQKKNKRLLKTISAADSAKSLAMAVAVGIKKKGIAKSKFFDNAVDFSFGKGFINAISKTVGQDIKIYIRQINKQINENNNK
ncbi:hypothetical protein UFOVP617_54 [uncultured Caudovirales phage]|uniref:Uncharacterized protein n=1 Tax=uncultured Caudovirales phage TaxID=2100421 RepID=A0A6J5NCI6_9CAUD|nr:hypothetical protein UFOVP617_54 [uncultured Caudovirales phage]